MSVTQIESDIQETRDRVTQEIGAISDKLSPQQIKQRAKHAARQKGQNMLRTVKENPVPSAIVALGLALLFKARKDKSAEDRYSRRDWSPNTSGEASGIRQKTEEVAGNLKGKAHEIAGAAGEKVQQAAHQVSEKARRTGTSLQGFFESNPIIAGAGVLVLGAAIGALIPETEKEKRLMGHTRDEIVDKTKSVVQQAQGTIEQKMSEHSGNPSAGWGSGQQSK